MLNNTNTCKNYCYGTKIISNVFSIFQFLSISYMRLYAIGYQFELSTAFEEPLFKLLYGSIPD
jgi:hypothetical protein